MSDSDKVEISRATAEFLRLRTCCLLNGELIKPEEPTAELKQAHHELAAALNPPREYRVDACSGRMYVSDAVVADGRYCGNLKDLVAGDNVPVPMTRDEVQFWAEQDPNAYPRRGAKLVLACRKLQEQGVV